CRGSTHRREGFRPMRYLGAAGLLFCLATGVLAPASCAQGNTSSGTGGTGGTGDCTLCVTSADCAGGTICGQFSGDSYCAPDCSGGQSCGSGHSCTPVSTVDGNPASVCVPVTNPCGGSGSSSGTTTSGGPPTVCGILDGPTVQAGCNSCSGSSNCQP